MDDKITILIADDNKPLADSLSEYFKDQSYVKKVLTAYNGLEAWELASSFKPDIVLLDVIMPVLDGIGFLKRVSSHIAVPPTIIALSVSANDITMKAVMDLGADYYIIKPQRTEYIADVVKELVKVGSKTVLINESKPVASSVMEERVSKVIRDFGIPANIRGYHYIRSGVLMSIENMELLNYVTKLLYPAIAKRHQTTPSCVERAIRHSIQVAYNKSGANAMSGFFAATLGKAAKPSNSEFIATIADSMRLQF